MDAKSMVSLEDDSPASSALPVCHPGNLREEKEKREREEAARATARKKWGILVTSGHWWFEQHNLPQHASTKLAGGQFPSWYIYLTGQFFIPVSAIWWNWWSRIWLQVSTGDVLNMFESDGGCWPRTGSGWRPSSCERCSGEGQGMRWWWCVRKTT